MKSVNSYSKAFRKDITGRNWIMVAIAFIAYFLIAIAVSYTFSDYYSIFGAQKIVYSKLQNAYVNHETL